ncbi:MAG: phosphoribosylglycinamide formyltransferase [Chitinophagaceae bacterium]
MFERLQTKWNVSGPRFFLILCTFAVTGTLTAWISDQITLWVGLVEDSFWLWKVLLRILVLVFGYQFIILCVAFLFGQFSFFWNYEKKVLKALFGKKRTKKRVAIFASGTGTNARKIIDHFKNSKFVSIDLIVSNKKNAGVLSIAAQENIPTIILDKQRFQGGDHYVPSLRSRNIDLIVLAGFLWKIPDGLVEAFPRKIINIHPALLPNYGGKGMYGHFVHEAVVAAGEKESGITIHYVDEHYDNGDTIFQAKVDVDPTDTPDSLAQKIQILEHKFFPVTIENILKSL